MIRYATFVIFMVIAVGLVLEGGQRGAETYERMLVERIRQGLAAIDIGWVRLKSDGLRIEIRGRAPSVEGQALALQTAHATAPRAHIVDYSSAKLTAPPKRDPILIEVHRDSTGITVTGRLHGERMKRDFATDLARILPDVAIHDLSGEDAARPDTSWGPELELATLAVASLSDAYLSVAPGQVRIDGLVPDPAARDSFGAQLLALAGPDIALSLNLRTPPFAIAPFEFTVTKTFGGLRVENCAARNDEERNQILRLLLRFRSAEHGRTCRYGLGGPDGDWVGAIEAGLTALDHLPTGRIKIGYSDVTLEALQPVEAELLAITQASLDGLMPAGFSARFLPFGNGLASAVPRNGFWLKISGDPTHVGLEGRVPGEAERDAMILYARALFSGAQVDHALTIVDVPAPEDWQFSAQSTLQVLALLDHGRAELSPGRLSVAGALKNPSEAGILHRDLEAVLPGFDVSTRFTVDLPRAIASLPLSPQACIGQLNRLILDQPVEFATGNATIEDESMGLLGRLADTIRQCGDVSFGIAGHTDSQGAEDYNQRLSRARAEAVMDALIELGVVHDRMTAEGLGESDPLASNQTPEGRALNRRIEFRIEE